MSERLTEDEVKLWLKKARASKKRGSEKMQVPPSIAIRVFEELNAYHERFPDIVRENYHIESGL